MSMRSSIACARCRRSKVKCINEGANTTCRACEQAGRECTYPPPASWSASRPRESNGTTLAASGAAVKLENGDLQNGRRQRTKVATPSTMASLKHVLSHRALIDALDPVVLTPTICREVFQIFQLHYASEIFFVHPPTFLKAIRSQSVPPPPEQSFGSPVNGQTASFGSPMLLLGILALTAKFHQGLVLHHSTGVNRPNAALAASEYYAEALRTRLAGIAAEETSHYTLEHIQAMLLLALHEWTMCRGSKAWLLLGTATDLVHSYGLGYNDFTARGHILTGPAVDNSPYMDMTASLSTATATPANFGDALIYQEIRKRTFWSCFVLNRHMSTGPFRPKRMAVDEELGIHLPCTERAFTFGENTRTGIVKPFVLKDDRNIHHSPQSALGHSEGFLYPDISVDEEPLAKCVRVMEIWSKIARWSCGGGRRSEQHPPWDSRSSFSHLSKELEHFKNSLPRHLSYSSTNIEAHLASGSSSAFTVMHTICSLCSLILHRDYLPFVPAGGSQLQGPSDTPMLGQTPMPTDWWDTNARACFRSAKNIVTLTQSCQQWGVLVETPIVGFAVYNVAFVATYCLNFPHMDPDAKPAVPAPNGTSSPSEPTLTTGAAEAQHALEIIRFMKTKLKMCEGWFKTIRRLHMYLSKIKREGKTTPSLYQETSPNSANMSAATQLLSMQSSGLIASEGQRGFERMLREMDTSRDMPMNDSPTMAPQLKLPPIDANGRVGMADGVDGPWMAINKAAANAAEQDANLLAGLQSHNYPLETHTTPTAYPAQDHVSIPPIAPQVASLPPPPARPITPPSSKPSFSVVPPPTRLSGDDVAAFMEGISLDQLGQSSAPHGWLAMLWHVEK